MFRENTIEAGHMHGAKMESRSSDFSFWFIQSCKEVSQHWPKTGRFQELQDWTACKLTVPVYIGLYKQLLS